jgi:hypothetical protein
MLNLRFSIENPWASGEFKSLYVYHKKLSTYKCIEVQVMRYRKIFAEAELSIRPKTRDHHGVSAVLGIFGYSISVDIYDVRHSIPL